MTEREVWHKIKQEVPTDAIALRLESRTAAGIPDAMIAHNGRVIFVELKTVKTHGETIRVRGSQKTMFRRLERQRVAAYVAIGIERGDNGARSLLIVPAGEFTGKNKTPRDVSAVAIDINEIFKDTSNRGKHE